ncbi:MAG: hypothetical protein K5694_05350 [Bacilli bacterium]|nr:hypothetical protein [Bacilli bacterium]
MRKVLWVDLFKNVAFAESLWLILYNIGVALAGFVAGSIIGIIYGYTIGLGADKLLEILDKKLFYRIDIIIVGNSENSQDS